MYKTTCCFQLFITFLVRLLFVSATVNLVCSCIFNFSHLAIREKNKFFKASSSLRRW